MAVPERRKANNHELSIQKHVKDNFADTYSITVNYQDQTFDASALNLWVDITFLSYGAGRKGETMVQFDVYSRVRGKQASGDRLLSTMRDTVQKLIGAMHTVALTRMRCCERTRAYVARRTAEGKSTREIRRCLKRYIAREFYRALTPHTAG